MHFRSGKRKPALLIPLNGPRTLWRGSKVLDYGDEFYCGFKDFSMRQRADNFDINELRQLIRTVHNRGKKLFIATNISIYDDEMERLESVMEELASAEPDAVICRDPGVIELARSLGIPFHISTQENICNSRAARFFARLGAERIILSRELSLDRIMIIRRNVPEIELEVFVHGAMCTAVSGRCYFSSEIMGFDTEFSANRGKCVQPCRRRYRIMGEYQPILLEDEEGNRIVYERRSGMFFNAKDLCMIEHLDDLIPIGLDAFKVEGRMRDPMYIETVARCYREAIDAYFDGSYTSERIRKWMKDLSAVFNRGFHTGFYYGTPGPNDVLADKRGSISRFRREYIGKTVYYHEKAGAVEVVIHTGGLSVGDTVIFEKKDKGFYHRIKVQSLKMGGRFVDSVGPIKKGERPKVGIAVDVPVPEDSVVFRLTKRTEGHPTDSTAV